MDNYQQTINFQFGNSPTIQSLIAKFNDAIDPTLDINNILSYILNLNTAQGFGLDILGQIIGVNRSVRVINAGDYFGFYEGGSDYLGFDQAPFFDGFDSVTTTALSDSDYLLLLKAKALSNISNMSSQSINKILTILFPSQGIYVIDHHNMTIEFVFNALLTNTQMAVLIQTGIIPKPAGVRVLLYFSPLMWHADASVLMWHADTSVLMWTPYPTE
jgi:hypothetical protein